jgi:hypothetical protein
VSILPEVITHNAGQPDAVVMALIGCVQYQSQASTKIHQTRFVYYMYNHKSIFFYAGQGVDAKDLMLTRIEEDDYAD